MNPDSPQPPKEILKARITALLLSELPAEEAAALRRTIEADAELSALCRRLELTIGLVRETATVAPAEQVDAQPGSLKLNPERRQKLLAHFKTVAPKEFARAPQRKASWLVPVSVAAILMLMFGATLLPSLSKAKAKSQAARGQYVRLSPESTEKLRQVQERGDSIVRTFAAGTRASEPEQRHAGRTTIVLPSDNKLNEGKPSDVATLTVRPNASAVFSSDGNALYGGYGGFPTALQSQSTLAGVVKGDSANPATADHFYALSDAAQNRDRSSGMAAGKAAQTTDSTSSSEAALKQQLGRERILFSVSAPAETTPAKGAPILGDEPAVGRLLRPETANDKHGKVLSAGTLFAYDSSGAAAEKKDLNRSSWTLNVTDADVGLDATTNLPRGDVDNLGVTAYFDNRVPPEAKAVIPVDQPKPAERPSVSLPSQQTEVAGRAVVTSKDQHLQKEQLAEVTSEALKIPDGAMGKTRAHAEKEVKVVELKRQGELMKFAGESADAISSLPGVVLTRGRAKAEPAETPTLGEHLKSESAGPQSDASPAKPAVPAPVPQPEVQTSENAFSTFSLNVSDVSFKLAAASLEKGLLPEPGSIRSEEFINAFDYRDPEPPPGVPVGFAWERARYPFAQNRDLLRFSIKTAARGRQANRPLNLVLLLDNSGSMERADRVSIIREALRVLATQLRAQDKLSVVTFARTARLWVDGVSGSQAGQVADQVSNLTPQGGTNLEEAMNLAYQTALRHYLANGVNRVVLLTDGAANLGNVEPDTLKQQVEAHRKQGIALDCFGIGWEGYNDDLLEVLARNGDGRYGFLNTPGEATSGFAGQLAGALHVAASDVKVQVEFNPNRVTAYRQIGYAKHQLTKEQFRDNTVDAAEIGAAESGNALYVIEVNPQGQGPLGTVRVRYKTPGTADYREHEWAVPYTGNAAALEHSSPFLRLAATASAFSEWLASSPYAGEVTLDRLLGYLSGVPEACGADPRPKQLEWMIRQTKSLGGK